MKYLLIIVSVVLVASLSSFMMWFIWDRNTEDEGKANTSNTSQVEQPVQDEESKTNKLIYEELTFQEARKSFSGSHLYEYSYTFSVPKDSEISESVLGGHDIVGESFKFNFEPIFEGSHSPIKEEVNDYYLKSKIYPEDDYYALVYVEKNTSGRTVISYAGTYLENDPNCRDVVDDIDNLNCATYVVGLNDGLFQLSCSADGTEEETLELCNKIVANMKVAITKTAI